jgi:hypothetical protein
LNISGTKSSLYATGVLFSEQRCAKELQGEKKISNQKITLLVGMKPYDFDHSKNYVSITYAADQLIGEACAISISLARQTKAAIMTLFGVPCACPDDLTRNGQRCGRRSGVREEPRRSAIRQT